MSNVPWHHRPAIIVALLVLFPPAGIALMWMRLPWAHKTKLIVSGVAGAWLVVLLALGNTGRAGEAHGLSTSTQATKEPPAAKSSGAATESPPSPQPQAPSGRELIEHEPRFLIPAKLDGFSLAIATELPAKATLGANASYYGENKHLVAHVMVNKADVKHEPDTGLKAIRVADHAGTIGEDKADKTISIAWGAGGWNGLVTLDYERAVDHDTAEKAVQAVAAKVAALLDSYLTGTPPSDSDRQQQLADIARSNAESQVSAFISKIEAAGITRDVVSGASLKEIHDELVITVGTSWNVSSKQERLIVAKKLWSVWADINTPTDMDRSRIKLVDVTGNQVGGSGVMGSSVKVDN